jgi:hypothetical protein
MTEQDKPIREWVIFTDTGGITYDSEGNAMEEIGPTKFVEKFTGTEDEVCARIRELNGKRPTPPLYSYGMCFASGWSGDEDGDEV